jgi:uncharacterized membrane protein YjjP (DUF1212 family)
MDIYEVTEDEKKKIEEIIKIVKRFLSHSLRVAELLIKVNERLGFRRNNCYIKDIVLQPSISIKIKCVRSFMVELDNDLNIKNIHDETSSEIHSEKEKIREIMKKWLKN